MSLFLLKAPHVKFTRALPAVAVASLCDTLLILAAVGGVSVIVLKFYLLRLALLLAGAIFLGCMGWIIWRAKAETEGDDAQRKDWPLIRQLLFAVSVSLLNPHAIMDTIGVIGTSSLSYTGTAQAAFTIACITVSWLWFIALALTGRIVKKMDNTGT